MNYDFLWKTLTEERKDELSETLIEMFLSKTQEDFTVWKNKLTLEELAFLDYLLGWIDNK